MWKSSYLILLLFCTLVVHFFFQLTSSRESLDQGSGLVDGLADSISAKDKTEEELLGERSAFLLSPIIVLLLESLFIARIIAVVSSLRIDMNRSKMRRATRFLSFSLAHLIGIAPFFLDAVEESGLKANADHWDGRQTGQENTFRLAKEHFLHLRYIHIRKRFSNHGQFYFFDRLLVHE